MEVKLILGQQAEATVENAAKTGENREKHGMRKGANPNPRTVYQKDSRVRYCLSRIKFDGGWRQGYDVPVPL